MEIRKLPLLLIMLLIINCMNILSFGQTISGATIVSPKSNERITDEKLIIKVKTDKSSLNSKQYVTSILTYPGGAIERISLSDEGMIDEDIPADGIFVAKLEHLQVPGDYLIRAKIWSDGVETWTDKVNFTFIPENQQLKKTDFLENKLYLFIILTVILFVLLVIIVRKSKKTASTSVVPEIQQVPDSSDKNVDDVIKEIRRLRTEIGIIAETVQDSNSELSEKLSFIEASTNKTNDNDDLYNLRLELEASKNALDKWKETAIEYFETLERGIEGYGEDDPRGKALLRDASQFSRFCAAHGLERITAEPGDPLVDGLFQVVDEVSANGIDSGAIVSCIEWGYRSHTTVYKRAKIILAKNDNE